MSPLLPHPAQGLRGPKGVRQELCHSEEWGSSGQEVLPVCREGQSVSQGTGLGGREGSASGVEWVRQGVVEESSSVGRRVELRYSEKNTEVS